MAATAELIQTKEFKSFDPLASVDLYRFDLLTYGQLMPETEARVHDEELSYIAEGVDKPLYTQFVLEERDGELALFDRGKWVPYISTLERGKQTAQTETTNDYRKKFTADRAARDLLIGYQLKSLGPGEKMSWYSNFPDEECEAYGPTFVGSLGYQPLRRMGFLYHAERLESGCLVLQTQSVDNSHEAAFEAAMAAHSGGIEAMRDSYDQVLSLKHGGEYYAGRDTSLYAATENAWEVIAKHQDLLGYYFKEIETLARATNVPRGEQEMAKKRLTYGVWAALKERVDKTYLLAVSGTQTTSYEPNSLSLRQEISHAYSELAKRGEVLFGCGGAISGEEALLSADAKEVLNSIFSAKNEVLKCVTCPLCRRSGVDAHIKHEAKQKTITCSKCRQSKVYAK